MADVPIWPAYPIGSPDVIFALGVASIKYAELESSLVLIFATVLSIPLHLATMIHSRINSEACVKLIEQMLPSPTLIGPPTRQISEIRYFIEAFQDCTLNRNHLLHSSVATLTGSESALLYKTSKQGKTIISAPRLEGLRRVADDMSAFHLYGRHLSNALNAHSTNPPFLTFPWPDRPPQPHKLDYTSDPFRHEKLV